MPYLGNKKKYMNIFSINLIDGTGGGGGAAIKKHTQRYYDFHKIIFQDYDEIVIKRSL